MKNLLITSALIISTASAASAFNQENDVSWSGDSLLVEANGCKYGGQDAGAIARNDLVWSTTKAATIQVRTRGDTTLRVESDNVLRDADGADTGVVATVDYLARTGLDDVTEALSRTGTAAVTSTAATVSNITGPLSNLHVFYLRGTATMTKAADGDLGGDDPINFLANNTQYKINHIVTCTQ